MIYLKGLLKEKKITYEIISKAMNITISSFSDKINGKSIFNIDEAKFLIDYLGIKIDMIPKYIFNISVSSSTKHTRESSSE